jgi:MFS family permease
MTEAARLPLPGARRSEYRIIAGVSAAHFVSHYFILLLPPLFAFVRADYGVSYTELGLAITVFNVLSATLQTPAGFLVDRVGARIVLIAGLIIGASAFMAAGIIHSYWVFVAMFALAGIGNAVYHPADYAMLSRHVSAERMGQAFSFHTFAGIFGSAVAPASLLYMQSQFGWRGAFVGAALLGFAVAALLLMQREDPSEPRANASEPRQSANDASPAVGWKLLLSVPILINLVFFGLFATMNGGLSNYMVVALGVLHGTPPAIANAALSTFLFVSAFGVLAGGFLVGRTAHHVLVTNVGLLLLAVTTAMVGMFDPGAFGLILLMTVGGFFSGFIMPSRDMLVRAVTPPGAFGRVFGFVTMGFNIAGILTPLIFGMMMDQGHPRAIFLTVAACGFAAIAIVALGSMRRNQV